MPAIERRRRCFPPWIDRTGRALGNHKENFPLFLTAVVVVHLAGRNDKVTAVACIAYVLLRAAHALLYIAGVERWRSRVFTLGVVAVFVVFSRLARF
ncbi:MAG: MAPEG family protein [Polyangiaceae bacterium]